MADTSSAGRPIDRTLLEADRERRPRLRDLHAALLCGCCRGYLVNAVKVEDCLHNFCRSCIVQYIKSEKKQCPTCLSSASSAIDKPYPYLDVSNLVMDRVLQNCVYKLVPGLYRSEQQRQAEFYRVQGLSTTFQIASKIEDAPRFLSPDDLISLSLEYECAEDWNENKPKLEKRYLQCPAAVTVGHIEKLLRLKYSIGGGMDVEIRYRKRALGHRLSLMDVVYIYGGQRDTPMEFSYSITRPAVEPPAVTSPIGANDNAPRSPSKAPPQPPAGPQPPSGPQPASAARHHGHGPQRMIYDPQPANMQPRVELTEYARNIGLTAVKNNGSAHYEFREERVERDDDRAEFAKRRDREWAAQKRLDERQDNNSAAHRKRKKAKHSKGGGDDAPPKRRKLHAQITSPESPEDALKMKVKLTPTPIAIKHKHKHNHAEPAPPPPAPPAPAPAPAPPPPPPPPVQTQSQQPTDAAGKDLSAKEKLLQMRAVRRDKPTLKPPGEKPAPPPPPANSVHPPAPSKPSPPSAPVKPPPPAPPPAPPAPTAAPAPNKGPPPALLPKPPPAASTVPPPPANNAPRNDSAVKRPLLPSDKAKTEPPKVKLRLDSSHPPPVKPEAAPKKPAPVASPVTDKIPNLIECKPKTNNVSDVKDKAVHHARQPEVKSNVSSTSGSSIAASSAAKSDFTKPPVVSSTPKVIRPPPATIPLVRIKKSLNKTVSFSTPDKGGAPAAAKKPGDPMCDNIGALDLSGKSSRSPTSEPPSSPSPPAPARLLNGAGIGVTKLPVKKPLDKPTLNPMSNLQMLSESAVQILSQSTTTAVSRMPPLKQSPAVRSTVPMNLRIPTPRQVYKPMNQMLKLNEIKGPRSANPRPQNQTVRSIPNPSALTFRPTQAKPPTQEGTIAAAATSTSTVAAKSARPPQPPQPPQPPKPVHQPPQPPAATATATASPATDIKKIENLAKNLNIEKVTAELVGRASEANKLNVKAATQTTP